MRSLVAGRQVAAKGMLFSWDRTTFHWAPRESRIFVASLLVAILIGVVQGVVEWLPISSEGSVALALTAVGFSPELAVQFALFLHAGTGLAATVYYRADLHALLMDVPRWRPSTAFTAGLATLSFFGLATLISGVVALTAYAILIDLATALTGGAFIVLIGLLLIITGILQHTATDVEVAGRRRPDIGDAVLVGIGQGLAILPGISRSGTTASFLLLRGHDGESSFCYSFILSIPAAFGGGLLAYLDAGGFGNIGVEAAVLALAVSTVVGYGTIDLLMRVVRRLSFWAVCVGLGGLAVIGGGIILVI